MSDTLELIRRRQSARVPFNPNRPVAKKDIRKILEAASWAPTAHNMQNFEIIVVDDKSLLEKMGSIKSRVSADFLRENYQQLSFSEEELTKRRVGILGSMFPPSWRDPGRIEQAIRESAPSPLNQTIRGSPVLLVIIYDSRKRAPASEGDVLGIMSLGCVMENMWLMAQSLGVSLQILSVFTAGQIEEEVKRILGIPAYMKIAYTCRIGYPISALTKYLRVRRDIDAFAHHNRYGNKGID